MTVSLLLAGHAYRAIMPLLDYSLRKTASCRG